MCLRDIWNKQPVQNMTGTPNQSFCGVIGEYWDHISFGCSGTADKEKLCEVMKNQWSTYKRFTIMNKLSRFKGLTYYQAAWNIYLEQISWMSWVGFLWSSQVWVSWDQVQVPPTSVNINSTLAYLFLVWESVLKLDSVYTLQGVCHVTMLRSTHIQLCLF